MSERREIKFRAWDTHELEMIPNVFDNFRGPSDLLQDSRFVPLQYTGLKDKNVVEIYEGDIVESNFRNHPFFGKTKHIFSVEYVGTGFVLVNGGVYFSYHDTESTEVIGNVYENPELLSDKT